MEACHVSEGGRMMAKHSPLLGQSFRKSPDREALRAVLNQLLEIQEAHDSETAPDPQPIWSDPTPIWFRLDDALPLMEAINAAAHAVHLHWHPWPRRTPSLFLSEDRMTEWAKWWGTNHSVFDSVPIQTRIPLPAGINTPYGPLRPQAVKIRSGILVESDDPRDDTPVDTQAIPHVTRLTLTTLEEFLRTTREMSPALQARHFAQHWPALVEEDTP
jgi:hypothetical protein